MKLDFVHPPSAAVEIVQPGRICIGLPAQVQDGGAAEFFSQPLQLRQCFAAAPALPHQRLLQGQVATEQVDVLERRGLVKDLVGVELVHRLALSRKETVSVAG